MSPQSNRQHLNSDDCRKTVIYMPFCAALWCVQYFDCSQLELPRVLQYSSNYSSSFFYYLSTRNFLFPVIISTSGGRSQSLSAIVNSCEVHIGLASGHFCCSLADCRLPRCNTVSWPASTWALPSTVASLAVRQFPLLTAYFLQRSISGGYTRLSSNSKAAAVFTIHAIRAQCELF